ncbi:endonuclease/exonuclease/phosphatase family protein [bacterium SCSIO 12741]|nr:endonuclease/exonuclease/phosphatase family protein [bacterium SCSIO 12741]
MKTWISIYFYRTLSWAVGLSCLLFLISSWIFPESFMHLLLLSFAIQGSALLALAGLYFLKRRNFVLLFVSWATAAVMINPVILEWNQNPAQLGSPTSSDLRIAHFNVLRVNKDTEEIIEKALSSDAQVVSIQENDRFWDQRLKQKMLKAYPYYLTSPSDDCYGISVYSKIPFESHKMIDVEGKKCVVAEINWDGYRTNLALVHATSPGTPSEFDQRNSHLAKLAEELKSLPHPLIVVGDLNAVPWDPVLLRWKKDLTLVRSGGFTPTFPVPLFPMMIPLDHVMHSPEIASVKHEIIPVWSSDHFGVCASLRIQNASSSTAGL